MPIGRLEERSKKIQHGLTVGRSATQGKRIEEQVSANIIDLT